MKKEGKNISRRSFLKATSAIGISAVSTTLLPEAQAEPLRVPGAEYGREKGNSICQMCAQFCPANAYVKDGKVIRLEASTVHEYSGTCGPHSRAAPGTLYSADRITTPLIRMGERGEGKFRQASWEEALDLIGTKLKKLHETTESPEKVVLFSDFLGHGMGPEVLRSLRVRPITSVMVIPASKDLPVPGNTGFRRYRVRAPARSENPLPGTCLGQNLGGAIIPHGWGAQFGKGLRHGLPPDPGRPQATQ